MRVIVFANGEFTEPEVARTTIQPDDLLVAADGGLHHCLRMGLTPSVLIGDLDSIEGDQLQRIEKAGTQVIHHPARKDETDLELALLYAQDIGASEVMVLGGLGARWDQTLANMMLPSNAKLHHLNISFLDGNQRIYAVHREAEVRGSPGDTVSLIPIGGDVHGIKTRGLEYPLQEESLLLGATRGVSNVMLGDRATVSVKRGHLLCIVIHKPDQMS
jgi:thiamine pyrophosphokinase